MSDLALPDDAGDLAPHGGEPTGNLESLPAALRKPVGFFWALNKHLLATPVPLVLRLQVWAKKERLTTAEVRFVLNWLLTPEVAARHRFASDLLCDLAAGVGEVVKRRRKDQQQAEQRAKAEREAAEALPADEVSRQVRDILAGVGERS